MAGDKWVQYLEEFHNVRNSGGLDLSLWENHRSGTSQNVFNRDEIKACVHYLLSNFYFSSTIKNVFYFI